MLTVPHAGELKCLGPVHSTESNAIIPSQATRVEAHSVLMLLLMAAVWAGAVLIMGLTR